jgi:aryl-alcohol dehydrogenase-like predicted oxidoreductase
MEAAPREVGSRTGYEPPCAFQQPPYSELHHKLLPERDPVMRHLGWAALSGSRNGSGVFSTRLGG